MVRLKESDLKLYQDMFLSFNSTMVRLKVAKKGHKILDTHFQFHYGTIKSPTLRCSVDTVHAFNSTMVRLKEGRILWWCCWKQFQFHYGTIKRPRISLHQSSHLYFNSTMVRLKGSSWPQYGHLSSYFNSTMVRLKESNNTKIQACQEFQFHYGTIKSFKTLHIL